MTDLPNSVLISDHGPREGFQFEKSQIPTPAKIELIDRLSHSGLSSIQVASFVHPKLVPGMADAEAVVAGMEIVPGVQYLGLWLNAQGFARATKLRDRLDVFGSISLTASEVFSKRNNNRSLAENVQAQHDLVRAYKEQDVPVTRGALLAAFGCNFQGDIPVTLALGFVRDIVEIADQHGVTLKTLSLADTMAWATPLAIKRLVGAVQDQFPALEISLHLHDTRGMAVANAYAGLEMGVRMYDTSVAGLGGCPFGGHRGAAGNLCTEDLVLMCEEMGIETGVDLDALIEAALLAESIVGHPLPGSVMRGGTLAALRRSHAA